ncbi:uncharacterized protein [Centruroides vittatus]|uniref:uncharacterized protein n=1 Tax=Centruroides vittatus TaxID=120091 RepID=UPI003510C353
MPFSPLCSLDPLIKAGRVFDLQLIRPCSCHRRHSAIFDGAYRVYVCLVEVLLWSIAAKLVVDTLHEEVLCAGWSSVYGHGAHVVKMTFVVVDLYVAIQFGIVKRNVFRWTTFKAYPNEERHFENMETVVYLGLVQLFVWLMVFSVNLDLVIIPAMKTRVSDPWILLLCSLWNCLWQIYTFGQLLFLFFFMAILFNLIFERLKYIEYELASLSIFSEKLKIRLEDVMDRHQEMCDTFREINTSWNNLTPVLYLVLSHLTCYLWYCTYPYSRKCPTKNCSDLLPCFVRSAAFLSLLRSLASHPW